MKVRLAGLAGESVSDGPGLRIVLFFQGCGHHCPGCHNPETWPMQGGEKYDVETLLAKLPDPPLIHGITLSGGDPFYQAEAAVLIAQAFHARGKDVWAYTGFTWEELLQAGEAGQMALLCASDVLVDGRFVQELRDPSLPFRGSSNQRLIAVQESLLRGEVVEWTP